MCISDVLESDEVLVSPYVTLTTKEMRVYHDFNGGILEHISLLKPADDDHIFDAIKKQPLFHNCLDRYEVATYFNFNPKEEDDNDLWLIFFDNQTFDTLPTQEES